METQELKLDEVYVLNPYYRLRHDIHRSILYAKGGTDSVCSRNWCTFIHPLHAVLLSFFTYNRPLKENLMRLSDFFSRTEEEMARWVAAFVDNPRPLLVHCGQTDIHFPNRVLTTMKEEWKDMAFTCLDADRFLWKKLDLTTRRLYTGPLIVTLMLTNRCVTHCAYCYADTVTPVNRPLSTDRLLELIHEAAHLQVSHINLMGGEVFLHRDWPTLLKELVRLDIAPEFISTKIPLDEIIIGKLRSCNYQGVIQVSLDAVSPTLIGRLTGRDTHYAQAILKNLMLLDESGIGYQIATVLTSLNCRTDVLREMYEYLCQLKHLRDWRLVPVSNSITKPYNRFAVLKPSEVQLREVMGQIRRLTQQSSAFPIILGTDVLEQQFGRTKGGSCQFKGSECSALTSHLFVLPDGKVSICEQLYWNDRFLIGDVSQESLVDVWNSDKAHRLYTLSRKDIQPQSYCSKCDLFESCFRYQNRCWSNIIKAYGADCWDYPDPRCVYAPPMKNSLGYD